MIRCAFLAGLALVSLVPALPAGDGKPLTFNRDVRPILADACLACHGPDKSKRKAGLRLDNAEGAKSVLVAGKPDQSELFQRITAREADKQMPPARSGRHLGAAQKAILERWIREGAHYEPHWAYIVPKRSPIPTTSSAWPRNPIDVFVLDRLAVANLAPSPEAPRATLIRRVTLDLTGLPPTLEEVEAFINDTRPDAYERVVDRLFASQRFGERMALDWLDAARYADSNGYQSDQTRTMWPWRDWAVRAFNANMPFDQFTIEQIAGDLLPGATTEQKTATGFHRNHMLNGEGGRIAEESRIDYVVDRVDTTATVWLGLTLGCSRCHDHKFDPFTQKGYYQLFAYFNNIAESGAVDRGGNAAPVLALPTPTQVRRQKELEDEIKGLVETEKKADAKTRPDIQKKLKIRRDELTALNRSILNVMVMEDRPNPRETHVLIRGTWDKPGAKVTAGVPALLAPLAAGAPGNRLGLAKWLVDAKNPLPARVIVNRYWQTVFGTGIVKTVEDFGVQGEPPSHPELLDWLACEFRDGGWDLKRLLRLIVTSATYRQSSRLTAQLRERDPGNRLLARGPRFRLSSQTIRDQALALSGLLVERSGGPPVRPYQPAGIWEDLSFGRIRYQQDHGADLYRRSLYTFWRRTVGPTNLFDASPRQVCAVKPSRTNTPVHALVLLNDVTYVEASRVLGQRASQHGRTTPERLKWLFAQVMLRQPSSRELALLEKAHKRLLGQYQADLDAARKLQRAGEAPVDTTTDPAEAAACICLAHMLLNTDEVLTKE